MDRSAILTVSYYRLTMRRLVIQALAYHENQGFQEIEEQLRSGQLIVPVEMRYLLGLEYPRKETRSSIPLVDFIKQKIDGITRRFINPGFSPHPRIEKTVEYLEGLMEVDNGTRNN